MKPVWIVDDDQAIRWVLEKALARAGVPTRSFSQAADVLDALAHDTPVALVSDIRMPGGNGLELLRQLKERHPGLPVIVMTAFADLDSTVSAFQGGAFDYLAKPFDVNEAVALIQRAMQESTQPETPEGQGEAQNNERWMMTQSSSTAMQEVFRAIGRLAQQVFVDGVQASVGRPRHVQVGQAVPIDLAHQQLRDQSVLALRVVVHRHVGGAQQQFVQQRRHAGQRRPAARAQAGHDVGGAQRHAAAHAGFVRHAGRHPQRAARRHQPHAAGGADLHHALHRVHELVARVLVRAAVMAVRVLLGHRAHRAVEPLVVDLVGALAGAAGAVLRRHRRCAAGLSETA